MTPDGTPSADQATGALSQLAGWGGLRALAVQFTARSATHDGVAERWTAEDRDQALIDSGIAAGYRGAAEMTLKSVASEPAETTARSEAIKTIASVLDQWENGALVNKGGYDGIVWIEPLWPLPRRADELRNALAVLRAGLAAGSA